jgi:hypothetical protein
LAQKPCKVLTMGSPTQFSQPDDSGNAQETKARRLHPSIILLLPILHFGFCLLINSSKSEGSWQWFPVFIIDLPISLYVVRHGDMFGSPLLTFGILGTLQWFLVSLLFYSLYRASVRWPRFWE